MRRREPREIAPPPINPKEIAYSFTKLAGLPKDNVEAWDYVTNSVPNREERFRALPEGQAWIMDRYGNEDETSDSFTWKDNWYDIPAELLQRVFSFDEMLRLWYGSVIQSDISDWLENEHPFLQKIAFCHWHYGCNRAWNLMIEHLEAFKHLEAGIPDFDVRIIYTRTSNTCAWAWAEGMRELYIDASFGLLLYYKGRHVLTVGFAPNKRGVFVAQAQLRQRKGNRFLYHLPAHYLDIALGILRRAFGDRLWLVTGKSAVDATRKNYGPKAPCGVTDEVAKRMIALYDRPLADFERSRWTSYTYDGRKFVRLIPKARTRKAA